ncbi:peptide deformylase [Lacticaseibacillus baoqingensis]|uniref:Peptide deformylase n=1 Tax=Lacticaseibacillus baoqingensis TaxID=2486013 RepID=A0ABW4E6M5_9LACO|nr:peptide deformylase [Lacticaseibacillus baoqingensis]
MIRPINRDQTWLQRVAKPATPKDTAVITDLQDTLRAHQDHCVGMAANMIGSDRRIIIAQLGPMAIPMINPQIIEKHDPYLTTEGCLSLSGQRQTKRYRSITLQYLDARFQPQQQTFNDYFAQIVQHECDHCDGILI